MRKEDPITIGNSEPEPDLSVVEGSRTNYRSVKPETAILVIEVAISSRALDLAKATDYAHAGISEYWILCPIEKETIVFTGPRDGEYQNRETVKSAVDVCSSSLPGFSFNLEEYL